MAGVKGNRKGGFLIFGLVMVALSAVGFFSTYPPGSEVRIWSKTSAFHYSTWTEIILTTGIFLGLGILAFCIEFIAFLRKNKNFEQTNLQK